MRFFSGVARVFTLRCARGAGQSLESFTNSAWINADLLPCEPMQQPILGNCPAFRIKVAPLAREPACSDPDQGNEVEALRELEALPELEEAALPLRIRNKAEDSEAVEGCLEQPAVVLLSTAGVMCSSVHGELALDSAGMPAGEWHSTAIHFEEE